MIYPSERSEKKPVKESVLLEGEQDWSNGRRASFLKRRASIRESSLYKYPAQVASKDHKNNNEDS